MALSASVMGNKRFSYFIIAAFIAGTLLLVAVQINSANNTNKLIRNNATLLKELRSSNQLREVDRDILGVESRIRASIATNDTSHLDGIDSKINNVIFFLDSLSKDNKDREEQRLIDRLSELALEKKQTKNNLLNRYLVIGNMDDTTAIANPRARRISDEITATTAKIYERRQLLMSELMHNSKQMGRKARWYDISILALLLVSGAIICNFIVQQFRKQNRLIIQLDKSERKALEAAQTKENFLANMSHEIRTPLSGILGFTNLLKKRSFDTQADLFIDSIQKSGENLLTIINDILDLSKIEAGMMRIVPGLFSVRGLMHSVETLFSERIREKGLVLVSNIETNIPDTLNGDATRLTQVLVNLIGNAIKFTEKGSVAISVYAKELTSHKIILGFKVNDTGIGIHPEKLGIIFERFNQAEDSVTRNYGGTGLGLSIVKKLVLMQGGDIVVDSQPGIGTTFEFHIPYEIAAEQLHESLPIDTTWFRDENREPIHILVVDDNLMNQSLMEHLLLQWHITFDIVSNGADAIHHVKLHKYDLILMDIQMPQMDGYTATQLIRNELKMDIPIIAMTAHAIAGEREKCMSRGMNEYISKPINEKDLFKLISHFVAAPIKDIPASKMEPETMMFEVIDLSYMKDISQGDKDFEANVTQQFITSAHKGITDINQAFEHNDFKSINAIAHDLKTSVSIMGLLPLLHHSLDTLEYASSPDIDTKSALLFLQNTLSKAIKDAQLLMRQF